MVGIGFGGVVVGIWTGCGGRGWLRVVHLHCVGVVVDERNTGVLQLHVHDSYWNTYCGQHDVEYRVIRVHLPAFKSSSCGGGALAGPGSSSMVTGGGGGGAGTGAGGCAGRALLRRRGLRGWMRSRRSRLRRWIGYA